MTWALGLSLLFNAGFLGAALISILREAPPADEAETAGDGPGAPYPDELGLRDNQRSELEAQRRDLFREVETLRTEVRSLRERLWELVAAEETDPERIRSTVAEIAEGQRRIQQLVVDHVLWMKGRLDGPQREGLRHALTERMCRCPMCDGACMKAGNVPREPGEQVMEPAAALPGTCGCDTASSSFPPAPGQAGCQAGGGGSGGGCGCGGEAGRGLPGVLSP